MGPSRLLPLRAVVAAAVLPGTVACLGPLALIRSGGGSLPTRIGLIEVGGLALGTASLLLLGSSLRSFIRTGRGTAAPVDPPTKLVVTGAYRWVRNPMYLAVEGLILSEAIVFRSPVLVAYALIVMVAFHLFVVGYEEPNLRRRFGDAYQAYARTVRRWLPRRPANPRA